jgi:transcription antitermination factor NusG
MAAWFLIRVEPNRERFAEKVLHDWLGCSVYFPKVWVERIRYRKLEQVLRPFFPRYAFVEDDGRGVRHIRSAPGVSCVIGTSDGPTHVRQSIIDAIRGQATNDVVQAWQPGQPVRINGLDAIFKERSGIRRAQVLIRMFSTEYDMLVNVNQLEAVVV